METNAVREWFQRYLFGADGDQPSYTDMRNEYTNTIASTLGYRHGLGGQGGQGYINNPAEYLELKEMVNDRIPAGEILRRIMIEYGHETDPESEAWFEGMIADRFESDLRSHGVNGSWGEFMGTYSRAPEAPMGGGGGGSGRSGAYGKALDEGSEYPTIDDAMADSGEDAAFAAASIRNRRDRLEQVEAQVGGLSATLQAITQQILSQTQPTNKPKGSK